MLRVEIMQHRVAVQDHMDLHTGGIQDRDQDAETPPQLWAAMPTWCNSVFMLQQVRGRRATRQWALSHIAA